MPPEPEPSGWELQRSLERLRADLQSALDRAEKHITTDSLATLLARYDDQLRDLNEDLAQERGLRTADVTAIRDWMKTEFERIERDYRERVKTVDDRLAKADNDRRLDRRIIWTAAAALAANVLLDLYNRAQGVG